MDVKDRHFLLKEPCLDAGVDRHNWEMSDEKEGKMPLSSVQINPVGGIFAYSLRDYAMQEVHC